MCDDSCSVKYVTLFVGTDMLFDETSPHTAPPLLTSRDVGFKFLLSQRPVAGEVTTALSLVFDLYRHLPAPHGLENVKIGDRACLLLVVWAIALHGMYESRSHLQSRENSTSDAQFPIHLHQEENL